MSNNEKILGIDLGTTNSVLSLLKDGVPEIIPVQGDMLLPSVVGRSSSGELLVGTPAHNQWIVAPERTLRSIKRKIGSDETISMGDESYTPQEVSAFILRAIKAAAEADLGAPIEKAVITVPAYFNEVQRQATIEAGTIAGLQVARIINEPTAAHWLMVLARGEDQSARILVYDLGGGTFDVSIIELNYGIVDVMATAGDNMLGGDDFDERLAARIADEFMEEHEIDLRQDHRAWARLLRGAEEAKIALSSEPYTTISLEYIVDDKNGNPLHIERKLDRDEFEEAIDDLLKDTIACIDGALKDAKLDESAIDRVILVGGSTRIPAVTAMVTERMKQQPHTEIDPDKAVALGAAIQAGIIAGEEVNAILVDVTPLSLGIETATMTLTGRVEADHFSPLIPRNTTIPVRKSEVFSAMHPEQEGVEIKVYQGEDEVASKNTLLGEFRFDGLKPHPDHPYGIPEVHVNFNLDINGILEVTVTDRATEKQQTEQMEASRQRLSPKEIDESQRRISDAYQSPIVENVPDPGVAALLERAQNALDNEDLDTTLFDSIFAKTDEIRQASAEANDDHIEELCDQLIDLLFEAEA